MQGHRLGEYDITSIQSSNLDTTKMENKLSNIEKAIINKPENNIDFVGISKTAMMIRETQKKGNFTTTRRFKVN